VGHNLGLGHADFGAGASNNLLTAGSSRQIPDGVANIIPDGLNLSQLTASQKTKLLSSPFLAPVPDVLVDTNGSTPFSTDDFFLVKFQPGTGGSNVFLKSLTLDLTPVNAFFDATNLPPGYSGSPFAISPTDLVGLSASGIRFVGDPSGGPAVPPGTITGGSDPVTVPGPLPVLGVFAALRCARKLRKRTRIASC
jgi:hypothetical protein